MSRTSFGLPNPSLSRRGFLVGTGSAALLAALAACAPAGGGSTAGGVSGTSTTILPGTATNRWTEVLAAVNKKIEADLGIKLDPQYIAWGNFIQQTQLKYTAGEKFDSSLAAIWTGMPKLQQDGALADLTDEIGKYKNLSAAIAPEAIQANLWDGHLWGIPQVNTAARLQHFAVRQDLADQLGFSSFESYADVEKFLYDAKQKFGITGYGASTNSTWLMGVPGPIGMFNEASWEDPHSSSAGFAGNMSFIMSRKAAETGQAKPVPFWEDETVVATWRKLHTLYADGILNADAITADAATIEAQWQAGNFAATWAITDGTTSNKLAGMRKAIPEAMISDVVPLKGGFDAKPNQTFQADNLVTVNANGGDVNRALAIQDWLSIAENHNLLQYGIEGTDWKPVGDDAWEAVSDYAFPGFALSWRTPLELKSSLMSESESFVYDWAQDYANFTTDPFSSFIPDNSPVEQAVAAMTNVLTQYATPLWYGVGDVDKGIDELKKAADSAGIDVLQAEMEKQADAYLKANG